MDVGVFGATGYSGRELVRLLAAHPQAKVRFTTGSGDGHLAHEAGLEREAGAYFLALPHELAASFPARLHKPQPGAVIVHLSVALPLPTPPPYRTCHRHHHPPPPL